MKLTTREKSSLFFEGVSTVILLAMINLAIVVILQWIVRHNPGVNSGIFIIKQSLAFGPMEIRIWSYQRIVIGIMLVIDVWVLWWRLMRRYRQYQQDHIIRELHYIAQGHLDHRIPFKLNGSLQDVITSVNTLVDSVVQSMDDERQVEKSKDELITNVSHDLRTPLTSIIGYLGLIENKQYHNEQDILQYTHIAYEKAVQMKGMVDDLFEFTKVQQHGAPLNLMKVDLDPLLEQVSASFELEAEKKGIEISTHVDPKPLMIEADPEKLGRVFSNLVSNALKYGHGATWIKLSAARYHEMIIVKVANNGEPIPQRSLKHVFDRFYRVESSRSKATGGTGLGLAIVKGVVDRHHGQVSVASDEKETAFTVVLPASQTAPSEAAVNGDSAKAQPAE